MLKWFKTYFIDIAFYKGPIVILDTPFNEPSPHDPIENSIIQ